jgi:predicted DNA-binding transcriptional regulator YafY
MVSIPAPLAQLGVSQKLKTALLKLSSAMSTAPQHSEQWVRQRVHVDVVPWFQPEEPVPHLAALHQAVNQDRRIQLTYQLHFDARATWVVDPYGLVTKAGIWYLVCAREGKIRVYRVSKVLEAKALDEHFDRPEVFNLAEYWEGKCSEAEESRSRYMVKVRMSIELIPQLGSYFSDAVGDLSIQAGSKGGWIIANLQFETLESARNRILGYGRAVEVLEPEALRLSIFDFASQVVDLYSD